MKVCQINGWATGSTGKIMLGIADTAKQNGFETFCFAPVTNKNLIRQKNEPYVRIGKNLTRKMSILLARITGFSGCFAPFATLKVLKKIKEFNPDIIHLHNMHDSFINLPMLFKFIKKHNIKTVWTLHDCWAFTGHCVYFDICSCDKWKTQCKNCPQKDLYPKSYFDNSKRMYRLKKKWVKGIKDLTIVTPSNWLAELAKQSFLKDFSIKVINNGVDLTLFKPTNSNFKKQYGLENKKIVLGVSSIWCYRKGIDVFNLLAGCLSDDYKVVVVGSNAEEYEKLNDNILYIEHTDNASELAKIYTAADVFVNPTREENFPTVNIEALACGTPVITFNAGGSAEVFDETCGVSVTINDINSLHSEIMNICENKLFNSSDCVLRAKNLDMNKTYKDYVNLYKSI